MQYSFRRIFDSPEIELVTAASGEEGLKLIPKFKPDLVIMDIRMGGISGLETLRKIRQIDSKLLVILMTAYGTTQMAIEAMKLGAYDYLLKPFDVPKLKEIVAGAVEDGADMEGGGELRAVAGIGGLRTGDRGAGRADAAGFQIDRASGESQAATAPIRTGESGDGQGSHGAGDLSSQRTRGEALPGNQLRGDSRAVAGERIVRARTRGVHGRGHATHRAV